ncbi:MAG: hypothetical protein HRU51_11405 [Xanthomonadales bacterium]|nr:hypothetical protein [Xanthomonadales bacterium]
MPATLTAWLRPDRLYVLFKYVVFTLLTINLWFFFWEDHNAIPTLFPEGVNAGNFIEAYSATIDTLAWLVLLWLFELETAIIPDEKLRGGLKWLLLSVRALCYLFIVSAFFGYLAGWQQISAVVPFTVADPCSLIGSNMTYIFDLDEYFPIDASACVTLQGESLVRVVGTDLIGTELAQLEAARLALVDVINAFAWLLVVALLEVEVLLQLAGRLGPRLLWSLKWIKSGLYATLFAAAVYWGVKGDFIDFWDAFLWLVAFVFIELNIFQWHAETEEEKGQTRGPDTAAL